MSFKDLGLSPELLKAIADQGYDAPTSIQEQAIPLILAGRDLMASAQTGTGKTAGFTLPLLQRVRSLFSHQGKRPVRALILTPTRELAAQVRENVSTYGRHYPLRSTAIYGGVSINSQFKSLRSGVDIIIATPGRLLDHVGQRTIDLSKVEILVVDEADRMLDMGFIHDLRRILSLMPAERQSLLFSATFSQEIKDLADSFLKNPIRIEVAPQKSTADNISQQIYLVDNKKKKALLSHLITTESWKQALVFTRTKHCANKLTQQLEEDGIRATAIHGDKTQAARTKALQNFKDGAMQILVATDIAARGLDIDQLPHVVNFELPNCPEDYVHRIGRTGRAGNKGKAISLVCVDERKLLKSIERMLKKDIPTLVLPGFEPDLSIKPEPIFRGRSGPSFNRSKRFQSSKPVRGNRFKQPFKGRESR